jgi:hypothetical protein
MTLPIVRPLGLLAALTILPACSSYSLTRRLTPPVDALGPAPRDFATVCVIRSSMAALSTTFVVHDDGQLVGATRGEGYFCYWAEPGPHRIVSNANDDSDEERVVTARVVAGRHYWLLQGHDTYFGSTLDWIAEDRARPLVEQCDYLELVDAPPDEMVPAGTPLALALDHRFDAW